MQRQGFAAIVSTLIHSRAQATHEGLRAQQAFVVRRLPAGALAVAAAALALAFNGGPSPLPTATFALGMVAITTSAVVSRTGRILIGHALMAAALLIAGIALAAWGFITLGGAAGWLILAHVESVSSGNRLLGRISATCIGASMAALAATPWLGSSLPFTAGLPKSSALLALGVLAYGLMLLGAITRHTEAVKRNADEARSISGMFLAATDDLFLQFDETGAVSEATDTWTRFGLGRDAVVGHGLFHHIHVGDRPAFLKLVADARHGSERKTATIRVRVAQEVGSELRHLWVEMKALRAPAARTEGRTSSVAAIMRDMSLLHEQANEMDRAHAASEDAIRLKDEFLANMSHELRTPLNAIIGFSEMLGSRTLRPADSGKQREYAQIIHQSGQHLLSVVNSILDMSKLQSGTFSISPESVELPSLIAQCCDMVSLKAQTGRVHIVQDVAEGLPNFVGDQRASKQVILNLVSNAVKFTPASGTVTVRARPEGTCLCIEVSDTGIGIASADLAKIGKPFFQARSSLCRPYEGTGLGLSVVRGLVGLHGGSISLQSQLGAGTTIAVRLPLDCRHMTSARTTAAPIELVSSVASPEKQTFRFENKVRKIA